MAKKYFRLFRFSWKVKKKMLVRCLYILCGRLFRELEIRLFLVNPLTTKKLDLIGLFRFGIFVCHLVIVNFI